MTLTIDHIVIYVQDLQTAMDTYSQAGFTVNYGGEHADGITENALIIFADGTYLELIALVDGKTYEDSGFKALVKEIGEGYTGFALQSDDLDADVTAMRQRGIDVGEIRQGSRVRPDGEILGWQMATIDDAYTPFVIQDTTDRNLRVPVTDETTNHPNGATGIHELLIYVDNIDDAASHFGNVVGTPLTFYGAARFELGTSALVLAGAVEASPVPHQLALFTGERDPKPLDLHGAKFLLI